MRKRKQEGEQPQEDWDLSESAVERILDILITLIVMCIFLCWSLITFSVRSHIVVIILVPLLIYFTLSSPGMRLRMKERKSPLIITDLVTVFNIALCCLFTDAVYAGSAENMIPKMVIGIVASLLLCLYLCRIKFMYYLIVPLVFVINLVLFTLWDFNTIAGILLTFFMPLPYCLYTFEHPYYFGFGRVKVKGKFRRYPESVAKRMREKQADERKAERRARAKQKSKRA